MDKKIQLETLHRILQSTEEVILALAEPKKASAFKVASQAKLAADTEAVQELAETPEAFKAEKYLEITPILDSRAQDARRAWQEVMDSLDTTNPEHQAAIAKREAALNAFRQASSTTD